MELRIFGIAAAALVLGSPVVAQTAANAAPRPPAPQVERLGTLRDPHLVESSGVAASRAHPGILWTHNDSGDSARIYALTLAGELLASYRVPRASAVDWEDMALGPCPRSPRSCLYLGDTGDNTEKRRSVTVYAVPEPDPPAARQDGWLQTEPARSLRIRYPDGPHDVEAIAVDTAGDLYLVSKGRSGPIRVYRVRRSAFEHDTATAAIVDTLPIAPNQNLGRWVTGAAISPAGGRMVVRTYTELYFLRRGPHGELTPDGESCWIGAIEPQGEAVSFLDEETVILTSETIQNQYGPILRVRCPV